MTFYKDQDPQSSLNAEHQYLHLLDDIMEEGVDREGRNGKTRALWAKQFRCNLANGFPALTTKKLFFRGVVGELIWFLSGSTNDNDLKLLMGYGPDKDTIWSANARDYHQTHPEEPFGKLGPIYGHQWRRWGEAQVDQIAYAINELRVRPDNRRIVVSAWNPAELHYMALPPCHMLFQFFSAPQPNGPRQLSIHMVQRSCDMFLGVPFNIASYALLLAMVAQVTKHEAKELVITFNDAHIYHEHFPQVKEQLSRKLFPAPNLVLNSYCTELEQFTMQDIRLENYQFHPAIEAKMIV